MQKNQSGFTLIELIVVMAIISLLSGLAVINLVNARQKASLNATLNVLTADLKQQQTKSIMREIEGTNLASHGIYFEPNRYVLFQGPHYQEADSSNFAVNLEGSLRFSSILFPDSEIIFTTSSGEVSAFTQDANSITLQDDSNGEEKTVTVNRYGVVTEIN